MVSVREVFAAYRPKFRRELATEWAAAVLYRPVSLLLTPLVVAAGVTPTAVTLVALACALVLVPVAWYGGAHAWLAVGLLGIVFCILDCMDGDVARVTRRTSSRGAYADFITDLVYRVALYAAIGIVAQTVPPERGLVAGLTCAVLALLARACRLQEAAVPPTGEAPAPPAAAARPGIGAIAFGVASGIDHLLPVLLLLLGAGGHSSWILAWLFAYSLGDLVVTQWLVLVRLP